MKRLADLLRDPQFRTDVGNNARDFFQSASNTAASNVTAPVDGLAWLLRKAGVPVPQAPLGGSNWAQNAGLMAEPKNKTSLASLLGEAAGNIAPIAGYAKAPEIAGGINQMIRNANAPTPFNNAKKGQLGAVVWHGSPHKFDAFDASKIGTGEGAQAYGHGLYLAENPAVAKEYAQRLSHNAFVDTKPEIMAAANASHKAQMDYMKAVLDKSRGKSIKAPISELKAEFERLSNVHSQALKDFGPQQYKVDLPDEQIAKMLDWDKPLSQQAPEVQKALKAAGIDPAKHGGTGATLISELKGRAGIADMPWMGRQESHLKQAGIPGIRYLDGGSRGAGQGSSNFVVFPGNESLLKILSRNGQNLP